MAPNGGQVVVVTGASAGIGRATACRFGARGDKVALLARGEAGLAGAAEEVTRAGGTALAISVDVADFRAVDDAARRVENELGPIDVWVNDAFATLFAPFREIAMDEFTRVTQVTYLGYVYGTKAALNRMLPRDRGTIVQVGSALAHRGIPLQSAYCGAKHAIQGFYQSLRTELMHDRSNVQMTTVQLPAVNTPQFSWVLSRLPRRAQPMPPIFQPELAADAIIYAADHPKRGEYWVGGSTVRAVIGDRIAPGLMERYVARTGYRSQQTGQPSDPNRPANLWDPVDGAGERDFGARGDFDDRSHARSLQLWASQHQGLLATVGAAVTAAGAALAVRTRHSS